MTDLPEADSEGNEPSAAGKRRLAREMALQMLYQQDLAGAEATEILQEFERTFKTDQATEGKRGREHRAFGYAKQLVEGTLTHLEAIDLEISSKTENWRIERMPAVDRNVLRIAVYELLYQTDVPRVVVLDEAIELAKTFGSENSGSFVNGLLDAMIQPQKPAE